MDRITRLLMASPAASRQSQADICNYDYRQRTRMSYIGNGNFAPPSGGDQNYGIALRDVAIVLFTFAVFITAMRLSENWVG